jgi:hypothetical protein
MPELWAQSSAGEDIRADEGRWRFTADIAPKELSDSHEDQVEGKTIWFRTICPLGKSCGE